MIFTNVLIPDNIYIQHVDDVYFLVHKILILWRYTYENQ
jgi:hypothetical protein